MGEKVITLKGREWRDIEGSIAALAVGDPMLALPDDILGYMKNSGFPTEINSLISQYASVCGPLDLERSVMLQLRAYALYKCDRVQSALSCILCVRYGAANVGISGFWLDKLGSEFYYAGLHDEAFAAWIVSNALQDGTFVGSIYGALSQGLTGNFLFSLAQINDFQSDGPMHDSWKRLIRGRAFAGLRMYEESLQEITACIKDSTCSLLSAHAFELKCGVEARKGIALNPELSKSEVEWIREAHRKVAAMQTEAVYSDQNFPVPDSIRIPGTFVYTDERNFFQFNEMMRDGVRFRKYGRHGYPHSRTVKIIRQSPQLLRIDWGTGHMLVSRNDKVMSGKLSAVFNRTSCGNVYGEWCLNSECCFTIVGKDRTLDLSHDKGMRDFWVYGFSRAIGALEP